MPDLNAGEVDDLPEVTPADARVAILGQAPRGYTPVRHVAVQLFEGDGTSGSRASTVALLLRERKHRSLVLYLLLLAAWTRLENNEEPYISDGWVRALTSSHKGALTWSGTTLSRTWGDMERRGLITRERQNRLVRVTPRREDGRADYTKPVGGNEFEERYFTLPDAFWHDEWFGRLGLPALVVLLIIAKETNAKSEIHLTVKQFEDWYGVSKRSASTGLSQLVDEGLVRQRVERVKAPLSKTGWTSHMYYSLTGDFGYEARDAARARARKVVVARSKAAARAARTATPEPAEAKKLKKLKKKSKGKAPKTPST